MNGQQLTNSSNSANGTPSSSYPASLSSQSSRDPSPATHARKPFTEPYNHVIAPQPNHWPKDKAGQVVHSTPFSSPTPPPLGSQGSGDQGMQPVMQTPGNLPNPTSRPFSSPQPPSSQSVARFPSSHQPNNMSSQIPSPRPPPHPSYPGGQPQAAAPLQPPSNPSSQAPLPSQFQKLPQSPFQPPPNQFQQITRQPSPQPSPFSNQTPNPNVNQFSQPSGPNQFTQQSNQHPKPQIQTAQPSSHPAQLNQIPQTLNQLSQPSSKLPQPPSQVSQPSSQIPQQNSQFSQPNIPQQNKQSQPPNPISQQPSQSTQPSNKYPQPPNIIPQQPNQISQQPNQFSQPPNKYPQPPNKYPQPPNKYPQPPNPISQQPQPISQQPNQFSQLPNQFSQPPNQFGQQPPNPPQYQYNNVNSTTQPQYAASGYPQQPQQIGNQYNKRYPQMPGTYQQPGPVDGLTSQLNTMSVQQGFNKLWGMDTVDLLKCRDLLPKEKIDPPAVRLQHELYEAANCSPEIFRCTLTKIPETKSLLDKSRLPLGVLIHPFKDLNECPAEVEGANYYEPPQRPKNIKQLSVIQCTVIVRCRMCRTYINPFVYFVDNKRWKCNLCFRVNELPDEFQFDPMTKTYGDPSRRPEIKSATIEFIAPSEYMVRPPQPAIYVFVLDVSRLACESGYLKIVCATLRSELENIPGDARTSVAFITFDSAVHFYCLMDGQAQPHEMVVVDIDDMFLPLPENLLVNLHECQDLIKDLLLELPQKYAESYDTHSALGAALQAAYKLLSPTGGRVTVFQSCLPNIGPGALTAREDPAQRAGDNPPHLNPATDFYKKLALDCSGQQIAVDLFLVNSQYLDLATLSGVSRFSGGCMFHIPLFRSNNPLLIITLERMFQRYLTRKIGFESVMRLRCTRGLSIHTFHGNFFVRSTDLLSLPNASPDAGFGMQVSIDENLTEVQNVCFQAALLYTSSKGERRIRVHTLCLPVASNLADIMHGADQQCIAGLLAKMAVDRAIQSSLSDAREAFVNVVADVLSAYKLTQSGSSAGCVLAPSSLRLLPLYILALLKHVAFRIGQSTRLDDRVFAMCQMKSLPLCYLIQSIYPDLYPLHNIELQPEMEVFERRVHAPPRLQLSAERIDSQGMFLMDDGTTLMLYIGHNLDPALCQAVFNVPHFSAIQELDYLPELDNPTSEAVRGFVSYLQNDKPYLIPLQVIRDDSHHRMRFLEKLIEDKNESGTSYYEFLQRVKNLIK
ncbi:protein transport protein Sec24A-like isoform X2 [Macrosteles quadrilineatus]|uniref:protein transport protein Sec24A-like isoform X2 n=1 Tax=Macrosteles quadrilineatus TaxID=74068 RepID=UPI0023E0F600|nr:protein transport protein Sec24A-like isoform X2 [Macrosteles quadrilineatus]